MARAGAGARDRDGSAAGDDEDGDDVYEEEVGSAADRATPVKKPAPVPPTSAALVLVPGADCGSATMHYLSYAAARRFKERNHPRAVTITLARDGLGTFSVPTVRYRRHGYCSTRVGFHPCCLPGPGGACGFLFPCCAACCCADDDGVANRRARAVLRRPEVRGDLVRYGDGVALYFKLLATFSCLFFIVALGAVPSLCLFYSGGALAAQSTASSSPSSVAATASAASSTSYISTLSLFSLGNLGEAVPVCASGYTGSAGSTGSSGTLTLVCPAGAVMTSTEALYGAPSGECTCPAARVPSPQCPVPVPSVSLAQSLSSQSLFSDDESCGQPGAFCELSDTRLVTLPSGSFFYAGPCCGSGIAGGQVDFGSLNFKADPAGCAADANTVNRIVRGKCLGLASCSVDLSPTAVQHWTLPSAGTSSSVAAALSSSPGAGNGLADALTPAACPPGQTGPACSDFFASTGSGLARCVDRGPNSSSLNTYAFRNSTGLRLVIVAMCYSSSISLPLPLQSLGLPPTVTKTDVSFLVSFVAFCTAVSVLITAYVLAAREGHLASLAVTAADYTVKVSGLPPHRSLAELDATLRAHFARVLVTRPLESAQPPAVALRAAARATARAEAAGEGPEVAHAAAEAAAANACSKVADINYGLADASTLRLFAKRGDLLRALERASRVELIEAAGGARRKAQLARVQALIGGLVRRLGELDADIDAGYNASSRASARATCAFVTFHEEEGALRALAAYPPSLLHWLCMPRALRIDGSARPWVSAAPEPSEVNWANLSVPFYSHVLRHVATLAVLACALLAAAGLIFLATDKRRELERAYPSVQCPALLASEPLLSANATSEAAALNLTSGYFAFDPALDLGPSAAQGGFSKVGVLVDTYWHALALGNGNAGALGCYCKAVFSNLGVSAMVADSFPSLQAHNASLLGPTASGVGTPQTAALPRDDLCWGWLLSFAYSSALTYGGAVVTLTINQALTLLVYVLIAFERHSNATSELRARALYLLVLQFVNTGVLVLLLNAQLVTRFSLLRDGQYPDFSAAWYLTVGGALLLTMILNVALPHAAPLLYSLLRSCARCCDRGCSSDRARTYKLTQAELNALQLGPELALDQRYAQLYTMLFVCLAFSAGLPLLPVVLFVSVWAMQLVDGALFALAYRTPPSYNASLPRAFTAVLPLAAVLQLGIGAWMLSTPGAFPTQASLQSSAAVAQFVQALGGPGGVLQYATGVVSRLGAGDLEVGARITTLQAVPLAALCVLVAAWFAVSRLLLTALMKPIVALCSRAVLVDRSGGEGTTLPAFSSGPAGRHGRSSASSAAASARGCGGCGGCCGPNEPRRAGKGLPNYFRTLPPDVVEQVVKGLHVVKPELRPFFEAAFQAQTRQGAREELTQLVAAFEEVERRDREAQAVVARGESDVAALRAKARGLLEAGVEPATAAQVAADREAGASVAAARGAALQREGLVSRASGGATSSRRSSAAGRAAISAAGVTLRDKAAVRGEADGDPVDEDDDAEVVAEAQAQAALEAAAASAAPAAAVGSALSTAPPLTRPQRFLLDVEEAIERALLSRAQALAVRGAARGHLDDLRQRMREVFDATKKATQQQLQQQRSVAEAAGGLAESVIITGLISYDLHDNLLYASLWGLNTEVDDKLKRRLGAIM